MPDLTTAARCTGVRRTAVRSIAVIALGATALCRPAAAAGETDFVKAASAHGGFKAFVSLVSRASLADTLGASPVTVFMPTDGAFARLSPTQRQSIADLSPEGVKDFVGRFVFPGVAMASNDVDKTITSENGTAFDVTWYKGRLSLRDHRGPATGRLAYVVEGDIPAGPGVIDAVDSVLMPVALGAPSVPVATAPTSIPATPVAGASAVPGTPAPTPIPAPASAAPAPVPDATASAVPATPAPTPVPPPAAVATPQVPKPGAGPQASAAPPNPSTTTAAVPPVPPAPAAIVVETAPAAPTNPELTVAAAGLRGWPLKVSGNGSTGKVNGVMIGLPAGRISGLSAHFGGFLGFGGRNVFVPWDRVTPDAKAHVLRARMTAAEFAAAPAVPPHP